MSLTTGRGPLSPNPLGRFSAPVPAGLVYVEPYPRRVRGLVGECTVIDSERVQLVHRPGLPTTYAFPSEDVPPELALPEPEVPGHVAVPWNTVDAWYEEDEHLRFNKYPKNPYHRVDCLRTSRRLRVEVGGAVLVDTTDTIVLYETALPPRLYVAKEAVRMDLLRASESSSWCSYKGHASWWHVRVNDTLIRDAAWSYEDPLEESSTLRGLLSFDENLATVICTLAGA